MASLYRKYRPRTFSELVGQTTVVTALSNAIQTGQTVHAYLMTGPRGSGKTSSARLLAKAVNCKGRTNADPCNACELCIAADEGRLLDLIEIDAASNRGIDNMRDIRAQVAYAPSTAKHKVYIIDEAHMLSKEASNAFLKTLEEPPPFVMFILATTEVHKILPTIVSRCQRYDFRKLDFTSSTARLKYVAAQEGFVVDDAALAFIVGRGDGALRDMLGLLEQVASYVPKGETISRDVCLAALGMIGDESVFDLLDAAESGATGQVVSLLDSFSRQGVDAAILAGQLTEHARRLLWMVSGNEALVAPSAAPAWLERAREQGKRLGVTGTIALLERLSAATAELRAATLPYFVLELALLRTAGAGDLASRVAQLEHRLEQVLSGAMAVAPSASAPRALPPPAPASSITPAPLAAAPAAVRPAAVAPVAASPSIPAPVVPPAASVPPPATAAAEPAPKSRARKAPDKPAVAAAPPEPTARGSLPPPPAPAADTAAPRARPLTAVPRIPESPVEAQASGESPDSMPDASNEGSTVRLPERSDELDEETPDAAPAAGGDDLKAAWERVMTRIRTDSPRLHGILREVQAFQKAGSTLKLFIRKGHSFAMETLRKEPPVLMGLIEAEMGARLSITVTEDTSGGPGLEPSRGPGEVTPTPEPDGPQRERGWSEKKAVKSKAVQSVVAQFDGDIIRVD